MRPFKHMSLGFPAIIILYHTLSYFTLSIIYHTLSCFIIFFTIYHNSSYLVILGHTLSSNHNSSCFIIGCHVYRALSDFFILFTMFSHSASGSLKSNPALSTERLTKVTLMSGCLLKRASSKSLAVLLVGH